MPSFFEGILQDSC